MIGLNRLIAISYNKNPSSPADAQSTPNSPPRPAPAAAVRPVYVSTVRNDSGAEERRYTGSVASRYEGDVAFRVGGKVTARLVDLGQTVKRGQILARIDGTDYQLGADAAADQLRAAQVDADPAAGEGVGRIEIHVSKGLRRLGP